jgi:hypothetical protein
MSVDTKHPLYVEHYQDWLQLRDSYRGERQVKEKSTHYLPATSGMMADGMLDTKAPGYQAYHAYRTRARFPGVLRDAVETMLGVMHSKPPVIELPARLEPMRRSATLRREDLNALLRRVNLEQLVMGRCGLLLDVVPGRGPAVPYVSLYQAEDIINWDEGTVDATRPDTLNLVVLEETEAERQADFSWETVEKYRVLVLGEVAENETEGVYRSGVFGERRSFDASLLEAPSIAGSTLGEIPFVFVNTRDIVPTPDDAPLLDLSHLAMAIYRGEADYRQALFMQGQSTFVVVGGKVEDEIRLGAGAVVHVPQGGDAKFEGVSSAGLAEQRQSLENDYRRAEQRANGLIDAVSKGSESGEALKVRVAARTASLHQIALTGAYALEQILRKAAMWIGADPDEVGVYPNLDFSSDIMRGQELVQLMSAKQLGAPLSLQTVHEIAQSRGLTDQTWEQELERLDTEAMNGLPGAMAWTGDDGQSGAGDPVIDDGDE